MVNTVQCKQMSSKVPYIDMVKNVVRSRVAKLQEYYGSHVSIGYDTINIDLV